MLQEPIKGNFTKTHFLNIHRYMFCDIYTFAGKIRREQIAKGSTTFYPPGSIDKEINRVFDFIKSNNRFKEFSSDDFFDALTVKDIDGDIWKKYTKYTLGDIDQKLRLYLTVI